MTGTVVAMLVAGVAATVRRWPDIVAGFRWLDAGLVDLAGELADLLWPFRTEQLDQQGRADDE